MGRKKNLDFKTVGVRMRRTVHQAVVSISRRETAAGRPLSVEDVYNAAVEAWLGGKNVIRRLE